MTLRRKLLLVVLFTSLFISLVLIVSGARIRSLLADEQVRARLDRETRYVEGILREIPDASHETLTNHVTDIAVPLRLRIRVLDQEGAVVVDSGGVVDPNEGLLSLATVPEVEMARIERSVGWRREVGDDGRVRIHLAREISRGTGFGYVLLSSEVRPEDGIGPFVAWPLIVALLGAFLLLFVAVAVLTTRLLRPLDLLTVAAERVAAGALEEELPASQQIEVNRLGASVEKMRASLVSQLKDLERERRLLRATTEGLQEGLLLVSGARRVLLANRAFLKILKLPYDVTARHLSEVVRNPEILGAIEACLERGEEGSATISGALTGGRSYQMHVTSVDLVTGGGAIVVFFDVTRLEALERVRRQFVSDVSHELKTPVTAIRGATETLLDADLGLGPAESRFLEIAARQAIRMEVLISDLLDLSRIETGAIRLEMERVALARLAEEVGEAALSRRAHDGIEVVVDVPADLEVVADGRRLQQVFQNLVDNAVKFSPEGGRVLVRAFATEHAVVAQVRDEGPGIPPEAVDRVFNRFFRVDEGRDRGAGGTGIGLSIVKHLMKLHHGTVRVESSPGRGANFVLEFPARGTGESDSSNGQD